LIIKDGECIVSAMTGWSRHISVGALSLVACYAPPAPDERFEDSIIVTSHDEGTDFGTFQTFFVRPDVRILDEDLIADPVEPPESLAPDTAAALVNQTTQNLLARGYQQAASATEADLAVELVYLRTIYTDYYCYYWSDWTYWGYPGYYYYYPYSCDTTAWRSGMVATNAINLNEAAPAPVAPATPGTPATSFLRGVWFSGIYGAEVDTNAFLVQRALEGIDQSFIQSPYFATTP
jgi:hypothetical protein